MLYAQRFGAGEFAFTIWAFMRFHVSSASVRHGSRRHSFGIGGGIDDVAEPDRGANRRRGTPPSLTCPLGVNARVWNSNRHMAVFQQRHHLLANKRDKADKRPFATDRCNEGRPVLGLSDLLIKILLSGRVFHSRHV
jgi:hypothetical protein